MTASVPPAPPDSAAEQFVERLLAAKSAAVRRKLVRRHGLASPDLHTVVLLLVERAYEILGADPPRAEAICVDALQLADRVGDDYLRAMTLMRRADACAFQGHNVEARAHSDAARTIFLRLRRPVEAARTRISWINATAALGHRSEALAAARAARRVLLRYGEHARIAALDLNTGNIHAEHGAYRSALRCYSRALAGFRLLGDAPQTRIARCHANRGRIFTILGRHGEALHELELARDLFESAGAAADSVYVIRSIGELQMELGRYGAALQTYERLRANSADMRLDLRVELASTIATCLLRLNRPSDALVALEQVEADVERIDAPQDALGLASRRVAAYLLLGQHDIALSVLDRALDRYRTGAPQHRAWLLVQRAAVLLRDGLPAEALVAARDAERLAHAGGMRQLLADAVILGGQALLTLGRSEAAARTAERARRLARTTDAAPVLYRVHELLGRLAEAEGRLLQARRHFATAIQNLERQQHHVIFEFRESFAAGHSGVYERLARLQTEAGLIADALTTVERAKSRALTEAIVGAVQVRPHGTAETRRLIRELEGAREQYAAAFANQSRGDRTLLSPAADDERSTADLAAIERRIETLIQRLQIAGAGDALTAFYGIGSDMPVSLPGPGTLLIEYFFIGDDILRFRVDAAGIRTDVLAGAVPEADRLLRTFRLNLDATERSPAEALARMTGQARAILLRLHGLLLGGLEGLGGYRTLVIVPHGLLHYLPFHAFHDGDRFLVERIAVTYAPSAALYAVCGTRRSSRRRVPLILGHSAGGRLPFACAEAAAIGVTLSAPVYLEDAARRTLLETAGRRAGLIHVAAHGSFRPDAPLFSYIELADGPLTTADVFNLDLNAGLVALSGCETGRAVVGGGDELVGITRAFLYAGTAGLLVSQWRVDDASTAALMEQFYAGIARGVSTAIALQAAQVTRAASGAHPFFWAGFQIIGGDRVLLRRLDRT